MVTTLDVLSGGRAMLGIGAGDYAEEAVGLGLPFPPLAERFELLEETVQACLRMWHGERGDERPFHGKHVRLERPLNVPQSLSRPHPPILIAGSGERRTLPLVARYADACNIRPRPRCRASWTLLRAAVRGGGARLRRDREDGALRLRRRDGRRQGRRAARPAALAGRDGHRDGLRLGGRASTGSRRSRSWAAR